MYTKSCTKRVIESSEEVHCNDLLQTDTAERGKNSRIERVCGINDIIMNVVRAKEKKIKIDETYFALRIDTRGCRIEDKRNDYSISTRKCANCRKK